MIEGRATEMGMVIEEGMGMAIITETMGVEVAIDIETEVVETTTGVASLPTNSVTTQTIQATTLETKVREGLSTTGTAGETDSREARPTIRGEGMSTRLVNTATGTQTTTASISSTVST